MNVVVLLAGGIGSRMRREVPKQHIKISNHQIIEYTLTAFSASNAVDAILIVSKAEYSELCNEFTKKYKKLKWIIEGGSIRSLSVYNAVSFLMNICSSADNVIISDAVRPCIRKVEIEELFKSLETHSAATTGVEVYETILQTKDNQLQKIIPREGIWRQTSPEGYRFHVLKELYIDTALDTVLEYKNIGIDQLFVSNHSIGIVKTTPLNFKITTQNDLRLFETVIKNGFHDFILSSEKK
ncbi:MAG: IspD/TarI family cytidylyltransferase [Oscillospiraceae bacterium]